MINPAENPPFHQKCSATPLDELKIEEVNAKKREIISQLFLLPDFLNAEYYQDQIQIAAIISKLEISIHQFHIKTWQFYSINAKEQFTKQLLEEEMGNVKLEDRHY